MTYQPSRKLLHAFCITCHHHKKVVINISAEYICGQQILGHWTDWSCAILYTKLCVQLRSTLKDTQVTSFSQALYRIVLLNEDNGLRVASMNCNNLVPSTGLTLTCISMVTTVVINNFCCFGILDSWETSASCFVLLQSLVYVICY